MNWFDQLRRRSAKDCIACVPLGVQEHDVGDSLAEDIIAALNSVGFVVVHTDVCPYKTQADADAVLESYRKVRALG